MPEQLSILIHAVAEELKLRHAVEVRVTGWLELSKIRECSRRSEVCGHKQANKHVSFLEFSLGDIR